MKLRSILAAIVAHVACFAALQAQILVSDLPYVENGHERQVLDVYTPSGANKAPVMFWIHGGGWMNGEKTNVEAKPEWFTKKGFVFVSINHRYFPDVVMEDLISDVAKAFGWVRNNIAQYGGDPDRILVGGHSSGAQLAAIICTDESYLKAEGVSFDCLLGCIPVDGDTYDIPAIIEVAETRNRVHHLPPPVNGHRKKFGDDPAKHINFSAVTHVKEGKGIPPFFIIYNAGHPNTTAQAQRFAAVLKEAKIPVTMFGGKETTHRKINNDLGLPDDPGTEVLDRFVSSVLK